MPRRHVVLPPAGGLLVSTDVHGHGDDMRRLEQRFRTALAQEPETHWVILGDLVHAPDEEARRDQPDLYDYPDESMALCEQVRRLQREFPRQVHYVLGNHDHGHVGGPHTSKFYPDEVEALEATLLPAQIERLRDLFASALLAVVAPCGLLLCHGSPDESLVDVAALDAIPLDPREASPAGRAVLRTLLTSYGQSDVTARQMLGQVSRAGGWDLRVVVHGHDRDERGFFHEGTTQVCPVLFGAPQSAKRYLQIDLGARYRQASDLRDGIELRHLYD